MIYGLKDLYNIDYCSIVYVNIIIWILLNSRMDIYVMVFNGLLYVIKKKVFFILIIKWVNFISVMLSERS